MCTSYVKFKYIFQFHTPTLPFAYSLCHFHLAPMKNRGCSLRGPLMLKAKSSEKNFLSPKICQILIFCGAWRSGGMKNSDFYCKRYDAYRDVWTGWFHARMCLLLYASVFCGSWVRTTLIRRPYINHIVSIMMLNIIIISSSKSRSRSHQSEKLKRSATST